MAENITCLQSDPSQYPSNSLFGSKNTLRQKRPRRQGINRKGKKVRTRTRKKRQVTVLVENLVGKGEKPQEGIAMSGWSSGFQDHLPASSFAPHNSYSATNQNLGRSNHNIQVREALAYEPNLRNNKGRYASAVSQDYGIMGQNLDMGGHGNQGCLGWKIGEAIPSSSVSKDMNWRLDRPGTSERISEVNNPVVVVDYGHVRCNPQPNTSEPWGSTMDRDRIQSGIRIRPPIMTHENISFINNIAITEDIMSSLKKTVHLVSGGSKSTLGAHQNTTLPSFNASMGKRNPVPISSLFSEGPPDHHKDLDLYNKTSGFPRQEQVRVTQKKTDRNKAFNYLREWRQKINLPTDTLMLEREEIFSSDHERGSGLVDISPTSMSGLQQHEGNSPPSAMTSQNRMTSLYMTTDEEQRWKPFVKPVTSSLSSISDVEDFGLDERRNKDFSYSKEINRKDKFSRDPSYSKNPGLRYTYDKSFDLVETDFKRKGYGKVSSPRATVSERYRQSLSYRSKSRSRSPVYTASPSRFSRRSRSPHRKSQYEKSADNSRRTLSPISSTHRTSQEGYRNRHSPFLSPVSQFSSGYETHRQDSSSLQNLFDRPPQLSGRMCSRSPSPRSRRLDPRKFSSDSGGAKSTIRRNYRSHGLSPGSQRTDSRSQSPLNHRLLRYPALSSQSPPPRDRRLTSRSISPRNRRMPARSRSPRSLSPRVRRIPSRSTSPRNRRLRASRSPRSRRDMTRTNSPRSVRITSRTPSPRTRRSPSPRIDRRTPLWHQSPRNRRPSRSRSISPRNDRRTSPWHQSPRNRALSRSRSPRYRSRSPRNRRYRSRSQSTDYRRLSLRSLSPGNRRILSRTPSPRGRSSRSPGLRSDRRNFDLASTSRMDSSKPSQVGHRSLSGRQSPGRNKGTNLHHDRIYFDKHSDKASLYHDELGSTSPRRQHWSEEGSSSKRTVSVSEERNEKNVDELLKQIRNTHDEDQVHVRAGRDSPEDLRHSITGRKPAKVAASPEHEKANEDLRLQLLRIKERKINKRIEMLEKESLKTESQLIEIEQHLGNSQSSFEDGLPQDYKFSSKSPQYSRSKRSSSPTFVDKGRIESFNLRKEEILDAEPSPEEWRRVKSGGIGKTVQHDHQRETHSRKKSGSSRADLDFVQGGRTEGSKNTQTSYRAGQEKKNKERDPGGRNTIGVRRYPRGRHEY